MSGPDPYKILQVDPEAEDEVIAAAYRRLARKYHPDTATGPEALGRMEAINAAWEVLGKPARRAAYDRQRALAAAMSRSGSVDAAGRHGPAARASGGAVPAATRRLDRRPALPRARPDRVPRRERRSPRSSRATG